MCSVLSWWYTFLYASKFKFMFVGFVVVCSGARGMRVVARYVDG